MKILLSAYACEPNKGSEPGVGWNWALQAARFHDVWVITRANNRDAICREFGDIPPPTLHFVYHDLPRWTAFWKRGGRGLKLYYVLWQACVLFLVQRLHRRVHFDVVHHVTFNAIDSPGFLWLLDSKFVWGPVGGAQMPPRQLRHYFGHAWYLQQLRAARKFLIRFNPIVRWAIHRSACVLAANADTELALRGMGAEQVIRRLETAVKLPLILERTSPAEKESIKILWAGSLISRKAPMLALDIMSELKRRDVHARLVMVGDGPLRQQLDAAVDERKLRLHISLLGSVPYTRMNACFAEADVFLFTSLQDTSGNVVLEAMANALPVLAIDHHGVSEMVSAACGIKVPVGDPAMVVNEFADALEKLTNDPALMVAMGNAGRRRAASLFAWDDQGAFIDQVYRQL